VSKKPKKPISKPSAAAIRAARQYLASQGGKARWEGISAKEHSELARKAVSARWAKTTAKERSEIARRAVQARWQKERKGRDGAA
jgi:hypothetical protein